MLNRSGMVWRSSFHKIDCLILEASTYGLYGVSLLYFLEKRCLSEDTA